MTAIHSNERDSEEYSFVYGDDAIAYEVIRKKRPLVEKQESATTNKRKITLRVSPSGEVQVIAPDDATNEAIHEAVIKRAKWIWDALVACRSQQEFVKPKDYVSGEMQFYLGKRYVLKVVEDYATGPKIKMTRGKLLVTLSQFDEHKTARVKALVTHWYQANAERVFQERLMQLLPETQWVKGVPFFRVLPMQKQWGSCSARGSLLLNPHLIKAPKDCIDYVILHELCHIAEHNHSERFWRLLTQVMPNWKEVKNRLDSMAELYLNE
ncbi:M48 family metallopeptidase [Marinomonas primoryensis]|uniref:SprT family zinc-dependent metalloprotease n=1 Tax=Marinomonas primoryensis TaxID=178399 RepID=A0ABV0KYS4_9GAMM